MQCYVLFKPCSTFGSIIAIPSDRNSCNVSVPCATASQCFCVKGQFLEAAEPRLGLWYDCMSTDCTLEKYVLLQMHVNRTSRWWSKNLLLVTLPGDWLCFHLLNVAKWTSFCNQPLVKCNQEDIRRVPLHWWSRLAFHLECALQCHHSICALFVHVQYCSPAYQTWTSVGRNAYKKCMLIVPHVIDFKNGVLESARMICNEAAEKRTRMDFTPRA